MSRDGWVPWAACAAVLIGWDVWGIPRHHETASRAAGRALRHPAAWAGLGGLLCHFAGRPACLRRLDPFAAAARRLEAR